MNQQAGDQGGNRPKTAKLAGGAAFFTLLGSVLAAGVTEYGGTSLERQKYEISLITSILSNEEIEPEEAANQLRFLAEIGTFRTWGRRCAIERLIKNPNALPDFELHQGESGTNVGENSSPVSDIGDD
jgi:hypothetical protein